MAAMTDQQAKEIASGLTENDDWLSPDVRGVARSLKALIPELGEPWAVVELQSIPDTDSPAKPWLLSLVSDRGALSTLWTAFVYPADNPKYEWPKLMVQRYGSMRWGLSTVTDAIHSEGNAERVLRAWMLRIGDERYAFKTDEIVGHPSPSPAEQFGRAMAAAEGWEITAVEPEG
jgi:hypothetical protein